MMSFFNYKKDSKKGYMEREGFFYNEIHMKCAGVIHFTLLQQQKSKVFCKKGVLKNSAIFKVKHLWQSLLTPQACNFIKKEIGHRCFPVNLRNFYKNTFFYRTPLVVASKKNMYKTNRIPWKCIVLYCVVLYCIVLYCIVQGIVLMTAQFVQQIYG